MDQFHQSKEVQPFLNIQDESRNQTRPNWKPKEELEILKLADRDTQSLS